MPTPNPDDRADAAPASALSERDRAILDLERTSFHHRGTKEQVIRDRFGISPTRYYQLLRAIIQTPAAMEADPFTTRRLLRLADVRARSKSARRLP